MNDLNTNIITDHYLELEKVCNNTFFLSKANSGDLYNFIQLVRQQRPVVKSIPQSFISDNTDLITSTYNITSRYCMDKYYLCISRQEWIGFCWKFSKV